MKNINKPIRVLALALIAASVLTGCNCNNNCQTTNTQNNMNNTIETIMTRTSIRSFTDRAVSADTIEMLLRAGMAAPTAVNLQPWHFVAVNDRAKLDELGGNGRQSKMLQESTLAIVVCGDMNKAMEGPGQAFWVQDSQPLPKTSSWPHMPLASEPFGRAATPSKNAWPMSAKC